MKEKGAFLSTQTGLFLGEPAADWSEDQRVKQQAAKDGLTTMFTLAKKYDVVMPITFALYDVLFNGKNAKDGVDILMGRGKKPEMEDLTNILDERND